MRQILGPALCVAALVASVLVGVSPFACVVECSEDGDCAPPYFRCVQNVCVECVQKEDCQQLYGEARQCWHGYCCDGARRGCWMHPDFGDPNECLVHDDCLKLFDTDGDLSTPGSALPFCMEGKCAECRGLFDCCGQAEENRGKSCGLECKDQDGRKMCVVDDIT